jgi:cytochrome c oxidase subunit 2
MTSMLERAAQWTRYLAYSVAALAVSTTGALAAQPEPWQLGFQKFVTPVGQQLNELHNWLLILIFAIAIFVLVLLAYVCVKFKASNNPTPSKTTHNTLIEVLWTAIPVLILVVVAIPSFKLLYYQDRAVDPDMTVKVIANQWYWRYEYPDQELGFDSVMIPDDEIGEGQIRTLSVDNNMVVPVGAKVQVLVTTEDVMHSFFVPSFGVQVYGTPGRVNETWVEITEPGVYYGQCNQICGLNHAFMPIVVEAMSKDDYAAWLKEAKEEHAMNDAPATKVASALTK